MDSTRRAKIFELALEECIAQFDYSNNKKWRKDFKEAMVKIAEESLGKKEKVMSFGKIKRITKSEDSFKVNNHSFAGYIIECENDTVKIGIDNGQSCCEDWGYLSSGDEDLSYYAGAELYDVAVVNEKLARSRISSQNWTSPIAGDIMFIDLETSVGVLQFAVYNDHNGYYGHDAVVITKESTIEKTL